MTDETPFADQLPRWALAVAPIGVLAATIVLLVTTSPFTTAETMTEASTAEMMWTLTVIAGIAGIAPVVIGMLWYPFIRSIDYRYTQGFLAISAGVLAFIAFEIAEELLEMGGQVADPGLLAGVVFGGLSLSFAVMYVADRWQKRAVCDTQRTGLRIAYLVAVALGLHSLGEGLAIGTAFAAEQGSLLLLLVVGFVLHNVMEGPTVVAAVATDRATPPLRHFAALGLIVGIPCVVGGWIGSFVSSTVFTALFFAIALGAILPALLELTNLLRVDSRQALTRINAAMFGVGIGLMFVLEDIIVHGYLLA